MVHPIEHLRFVARAQGADPAMLAAESAVALSTLAFDPSGLVVACRRVVERHPTIGPLWWMCSHLLTALDAADRADELVGELHTDPTPDQLIGRLPDGATVMVAGCPSIVGDALCRRGDLRAVVVGDDRDSDVLAHRLERADVEVCSISFSSSASMAREVDLVLLEADALDGRRALVELGGGVLAAVAAAAERPIWLVAGRGRSLPGRYLDVMIGKIDSGAPVAVDVVDPAQMALIVTPDQVEPLSSLQLEADCPVAAELCR